ncbi:hypothetical protein F2Q69_00031736 [Brassica cretica]|uniref:Uncharacterized protein n=1 Tax=Brassica cretica TaxID=69181 RepID=A0A8S9RZK1_BRACR|nr:hypothetical protein F2Q69_00031736 [Brassica cretica]
MIVHHPEQDGSPERLSNSLMRMIAGGLIWSFVHFFDESALAEVAVDYLAFDDWIHGSRAHVTPIPNRVCILHSQSLVSNLSDSSIVKRNTLKI